MFAPRTPGKFPSRSTSQTAPRVGDDRYRTVVRKPEETEHQHGAEQMESVFGFSFANISIEPTGTTPSPLMSAAQPEMPMIDGGADQRASRVKTHLYRSKDLANKPDNQLEQEAERVAEQVKPKPGAAATAARVPCPAANAPRLPLQARFAVSAPGEPLELEADRIAERVIQMPTGEVRTSSSTAHVAVQRKCTACEEEERTLPRHAAGSSPTAADVLPVVHAALSSPGRPLDAETRRFMEPRFGQDFSDVRVHVDDAAADAVAAHAFTVGHHIVFKASQYRPVSESGRRLLAHELTHVMQQRGAGDGPSASADGAVLARQAAAPQASGLLPPKKVQEVYSAWVQEIFKSRKTTKMTADLDKEVRERVKKQVGPANFANWERWQQAKRTAEDGSPKANEQRLFGLQIELQPDPEYDDDFDEPEPMSREDAAERLGKVLAEKEVLVLSPQRHAELDAERKMLEVLVYGETTEDQTARAVDLLLGGRTRPAPAALAPTRAEIEARRKRRQRQAELTRKAREKLGPSGNDVSQHVPGSDLHRAEQAAIDAGVPARLLRRRLTPWEARLRAGERVETVWPESGLESRPASRESMSPLFNARGKQVGYAERETAIFNDTFIVDIDGNVIQWAEKPLEGSIPAPILEAAELVVGMIPIVGQVIAVVEAITGETIFTGRKLSDAERIMALAFAALPYFGRVARAGARGIAALRVAAVARGYDMAAVGMLMRVMSELRASENVLRGAMKARGLGEGLVDAERMLSRGLEAGKMGRGAVRSAGGVTQVEKAAAGEVAAGIAKTGDDAAGGLRLPKPDSNPSLSIDHGFHPVTPHNDVRPFGEAMTGTYPPRRPQPHLTAIPGGRATEDAAVAAAHGPPKVKQPASLPGAPAVAPEPPVTLAPSPVAKKAVEATAEPILNVGGAGAAKKGFKLQRPKLEPRLYKLMREEAAQKGCNVLKPTPAIMRGRVGEKFKYVITMEGEVKIAHALVSGKPDLLSHAAMVDGADLLVGGQGIVTKEGAIYRVVLDNYTGHYSGKLSKMTLEAVVAEAVPRFQKILGKDFEIIVKNFK